jgi:hypothetical protein
MCTSRIFLDNGCSTSYYSLIVLFHVTEKNGKSSSNSQKLIITVPKRDTEMAKGHVCFVLNWAIKTTDIFVLHEAKLMGYFTMSHILNAYHNLNNIHTVV